MLTELEAAQFYPLQGRIEGLLRLIVRAQTSGGQAKSPALVEDLEFAVVELRDLVARGPVDCVNLFGPLPIPVVEGGRPLCPACGQVVPPVEPESAVFFHARASSPGMWRSTVSSQRYGEDSLGLLPAHWRCAERFPDFVQFRRDALRVSGRALVVSSC